MRPGLPLRARLGTGAMLAFVIVVYLHNAVPHLTMLPRVNVDEPWLMERAYQVMRSGVPRQPMYGVTGAYLLQVGYPYLLAGWMSVWGVGLSQARALGVVLGLGIVLMAAYLGTRLIGPAAGVFAALFLSADSNFLGGARNSRTDIPAVFFAAAALACHAAAATERGRSGVEWAWRVMSGACAGLAILCHGNAFWVVVILALWLALDFGRHLFARREPYQVAAGIGLTLGPYAAVIGLKAAQLQSQIHAFVPERVPNYSPNQVMHQVALEVERYRTWYFGLVTSAVPNPLLWTFQAATAAGVVVVLARVLTRRHDGEARDRHLVALAGGTAAILAAFVNNKVPVYMPHLLVGFSLLAGLAVHQVIGRTASTLHRVAGAGRGSTGAALTAAFTIGYGAAAVGYYEKWYSSASKSELVPYERTAATLAALVPRVPKTLYGSPHFWLPFHDDPETAFVSYATGVPRASLPVYLLVDEQQWLPDLSAPGHESVRAAWSAFIERHCALDGSAIGTSYGTIALYQCGAAQEVDRIRARGPRIVGGGTQFRISERVARLDATDLARWQRYDDPRRRQTDRPEIALTGAGVRIAGTGWPGIVTHHPTEVGSAYLIRVASSGARDGDLLYLGTWRQKEVVSLEGASSAGMATPLGHAPWFPGDRAFVATAPRVQLLIYSEAPSTDFTVSSVELFKLAREEAASRRTGQ